VTVEGREVREGKEKEALKIGFLELGITFVLRVEGGFGELSEISCVS